MKRYNAKEFIGKKIKVIDSKNPSLIGLEGNIFDETQNMLFIETKEGFIKNLIKKQHKLKINDYIIEGDEITSSPEERIKKWQKNKK
jgi:RNase P/RNase MRP subunit p29